MCDGESGIDGTVWNYGRQAHTPNERSKIRPGIVADTKARKSHEAKATS
jgi:hypothetical protein